MDAGSTSNLSTDNTFLFFKIKDQLLRLANDAAALPKVNVRPTGLEITQGIQRSDNSVVLVQNRTTLSASLSSPTGPRCPTWTPPVCLLVGRGKLRPDLPIQRADRRTAGTR